MGTHSSTAFLNERRTRLVIFTQGYFGEILSATIPTNINHLIYTYSFDSTRRKSDREFMRQGNYRYINERSYNSELIPLTSNDIVICIDWTKDFFHHTYNNGNLPCPIYHIHFSLLPKFRGYGAVSEQFISGVVRSGITMYTESGHIDAGDIVYQEAITIGFQDTIVDFFEECRKIAIKWLTDLSNRNPSKLKSLPKTTPQSSFGHYVNRRRHNQGLIDFNMHALYVYNSIRGYAYPYFGSHMCIGIGEVKIIVWSATCEKWSGTYGEPAEIIDFNSYGVEFACAEGTILLNIIEADGDIYKHDTMHDIFKKLMPRLD